MGKYVLAGTLGMKLIQQGSGNIIARSQTLQENSLSLSVSSEDIRGGLSNPLIAKYFHDSVMEVKITDAVFDLEYLAAEVGGEVINGADVVNEETVTISTANTITVSNTPQDFLGLGTIGWYSIQGANSWQKITFTGNSATVSGLTVGQTVCVEYCHTDDAAREFTVSSAIIPSECILQVEAPLFQASQSSAGNYTQSSQVGKIVITIPRFLLSGTTDLSMTSSNASTTDLSGSAMAVFGASCSNLGSYGTVQEVIFDKNWYEDLTSLAIASGDDIELSATETEMLTVVGVYGTTTGSVSNSNLTFTSSDSAIATVSTAGLVSAVAAGTAYVTITATGKPSITATAKVVVS